MKRKLKAIIWPIIYLVLILNVCFSFTLVFRSYYFKSIFVSGDSMQPTLNTDNSDGKVDYGIIDDHSYVLNNLRRFQIVITYYPFETSNDYVQPYTPGEENELNTNTCSYKIKRLYALPGETIRFEVDNETAAEAILAGTKYGNYSVQAQDLAAKAIHFYVTNANGEESEPQIKFKRKINLSTLSFYNFGPFTLGENEYWVMGDNYAVSSDCMSKQIRKPIYKENLIGVLIAIEGRCNTETEIPKDAEAVSGSHYVCKNRKPHFPKFF